MKQVDNFLTLSEEEKKVIMKFLFTVSPWSSNEPRFVPEKDYQIILVDKVDDREWWTITQNGRNCTWVFIEVNFIYLRHFCSETIESHHSLPDFNAILALFTK